MTAVSTLLSTRTAKASRATVVLGVTLLLSLESTLGSSKSRATGTTRAAVVLGTTLLLSLRSVLGSTGTVLVTVLVTTLVVLVLVVLIVVVTEESHDG